MMVLLAACINGLILGVLLHQLRRHTLKGPMPKELPERDAAFIEGECLRVARQALGCKDLRSVKIEPTKPPGSGPNWQVAGFVPPLPALAHDEALERIAPLRQRYALVRRAR
jgi:hypothetical protein